MNVGKLRDNIPHFFPYFPTLTFTKNLGCGDHQVEENRLRGVRWQCGEILIQCGKIPCGKIVGNCGGIVGKLWDQCGGIGGKLLDKMWGIPVPSLRKHEGKLRECAIWKVRVSWKVFPGWRQNFPSGTLVYASFWLQDQ